MLGLSSFVKSLGGSIIYTVPVEGGTPKQITPKGPSYLHGWSTDAKSLVFCGERKGEFDVYKVPAGGGPEVRLTNTPGLDDGPEYTPDGKYNLFQFRALRFDADLADAAGWQCAGTGHQR